MSYAAQQEIVGRVVRPSRISTSGRASVGMKPCTKAL
jgi:hypothetical protein